MALAKKTNQRPGSVVASRQVAIEDFYVTSTTVDFSIVQPEGTIVESVHVFFDGRSAFSGGGGGTAGDASLTIGTNSDFTGSEIVTTKTIVDFDTTPTIVDGTVIDFAAVIAAGAKTAAPTADRVLFGQITCGDASLSSGTNKLQVHIGFRHF